MTDAEMTQLKESDFLRIVCKDVFAWDRCIRKRDYEDADMYARSWRTARAALRFITGKDYFCTCNDGIVCIINDQDHSDKLFVYNVADQQ